MGISKDLTLFGWIQANTYISNASIPSIKLLLYRSVKTKCLKPIPFSNLNQLIELLKHTHTLKIKVVCEVSAVARKL